MMLFIIFADFSTLNFNFVLISELLNLFFYIVTSQQTVLFLIEEVRADDRW
ncbi:MAG: hypothetical protein AAF652_19620 [Cyanobacteria bacterium P01_C01_bin.72]